MKLLTSALQTAATVTTPEARFSSSPASTTTMDFAGVMAASRSQGSIAGEPTGTGGAGVKPLGLQMRMHPVMADPAAASSQTVDPASPPRQRLDRKASISRMQEKAAARNDETTGSEGTSAQTQAQPAQTESSAQSAQSASVHRQKTGRSRSKTAETAQAAQLAAETAETSAELPVQSKVLFASLKAKARQNDLSRALRYSERAQSDQAPTVVQAEAAVPKAPSVADSSAKNTISPQAQAQAQAARPAKSKEAVENQLTVDAEKTKQLPRAKVRRAAYTSDVAQLAALPEDKISQAAISQVGARYRFGGESPRQGFDCSGLTSWAYAQAGMDIPRSSREQYVQGKPVDRSSLQSGDLVFFGGKKSISHVGVYIEDGQFVHATSSGKGVKISHLDDGIWEGKFAGARRMVTSTASSEAPSAKVRAVETPKTAPGAYASVAQG